MRRWLALTLCLALMPGAFAAAEGEPLRGMGETASGALALEEGAAESGDEAWAGGAPDAGEVIVVDASQTALEEDVPLEASISAEAVDAAVETGDLSLEEALAAAERAGIAGDAANEEGDAACAPADGDRAPCGEPPELKVSATTARLGVEEAFELLQSGEGACLPEDCTFTSSSQDVARVSADGVVTPLKPGVATITVRTRDSGASAACEVVVNRAPTRIALKPAKKTLAIGRTVRLKYALSSGSSSRKVAFRSSNSRVAKVNAKGVVTALRPGTAIITAKTFNGKKASCRITVKRAYQALLVGQPGILGEYGEPSTRFASDVSMMKKLLESRKAPQGSYKGHITVKKNVNRAQLRKAIRAMAARAKRSDVTLFFIATHGDMDHTGSLAGALAMYNDSSLTFGTLAGWLKEIPGKVIVIISSCGSGAAIAANGAEDGEALKRMNRAAIDAFRAAEGDAIQANTGELRNGKFCVLTSSAYRQISWGREAAPGKGDWFVLMLRDGVAASGAMPADGNGNRTLTLSELKKYIDRRAKTAKLGPNGASRQNVQLYPAGSGCAFLRR